MNRGMMPFRADEKLSDDEKNNTYFLLIMNVLKKIEHVEIIKIENDTMIGKFKSLDFVVKCIYLPWFLIKPPKIKKFLQEIKHMPNSVFGFFVSNSAFSNVIIEKVKQETKVFLCHESDLIDTIKYVEQNKDNVVKNVIQNFEIMVEFQQELIRCQQALINTLKDKYL
ncbi:6917_t:CDS:2 [Dentiscutata heterogama]|uniref:6917_t:CDS:1 n=1 Tax=Dentiscutata heterogama TaxID=1316150 RepID=A0ACA9KQH2_9GLOM|nr:6917_t:CDS:2 [Dentiscutata heterogama]